MIWNGWHHLPVRVAFTSQVWFYQPSVHLPTKAACKSQPRWPLPINQDGFFQSRRLLPTSQGRFYQPEVVLAKQFDTESFRTLFGLGRRINPSLYVSVFNFLRTKRGSITWENGRLGQTIWNGRYLLPAKPALPAKVAFTSQPRQLVSAKGAFTSQCSLYQPAKVAFTSQGGHYQPRCCLTAWGGTRINPSLYISISHSLKTNAGSINWQNGCSG